MEEVNNKKQIVFFCATTPYVMIYKIAREFKKKGYETVLITISPKETWEENWYKNGFDKIICSNFRVSKPTLKNSFNMLKRAPYLINTIYEMKKLKPYVVFAIARPNYITALGMKFFKKYPVIYFPYDITAQQHSDLKTALGGGVKKYEINAEKYCFENADGIMHKGASEELEFLKGKTMLGDNFISKITPLRINFLPYCSDEFIVPINKNKLSKKEGEFHLVHVGGLDVTEKVFAIYKTIFQELFEQKIHIHLYIKTQHLSQKEDSEYISKGFDIFKKNKYFHVEYAVDPKKLIKEISKYDSGVILPNLRTTEFDMNSLFCIGNKISTFFEAGIPFIEDSKRKFTIKLIDNYKVNTLINSDKLNNLKDIEKIDFIKLEKNILKARKDFNMAKHFPRLEKFVEEVVRTKLGEDIKCLK